MRRELFPFLEQNEPETPDDFPKNPNATVTISYVYRYKSNWIEAGEDAVEQIILLLGFRNHTEFNSFFSIYNFSLLIKDPIGYIFSGINSDRTVIQPSKYFSTESVFSDYLTASAVGQQPFALANPKDLYLYLFGKITDNYSEADRFNHIKNWFINRVGVYKEYSGASDKRWYDDNAHLLAEYAKNKYFTVWHPPRDKKQKFAPPPNVESEPRSINITAYIKYLIDTFLAAYRKPPAEQDAAKLYNNEQSYISRLLNLPNYIESAIVDKVSQAMRPIGEFLYTGPAAKSSWKISTYVDFGVEIPVAMLAKAIEIDVGIWQAKWCVYSEATNEGYLFNANCFTIGASISLVNSKYGLIYLKKLQQQKITQLISQLSPNAQIVLKKILDTNVSLGRADLPVSSNIYETGGPITRESFNGNLETGTISLSLGAGAFSSQSFLISENVPYAKPKSQINPKTGGVLGLPPDTSYMRPKAAILMEGVNHNNSLGASIGIQKGFGRCSVGDRIDYNKFLSWFR
ncbi:MAG: hypothetical protein H7Z37_03630 [Pyrinomonadaceae bacterium]|nr:hypothetical protein [Pyrinomonadaceae bacterium]